MFGRFFFLCPSCHRPYPRNNEHKPLWLRQCRMAFAILKFSSWPVLGAMALKCLIAAETLWGVWPQPSNNYQRSPRCWFQCLATERPNPWRLSWRSCILTTCLLTIVRGLKNFSNFLGVIKSCRHTGARKIARTLLSNSIQPWPSMTFAANACPSSYTAMGSSWANMSHSMSLVGAQCLARDRSLRHRFSSLR